MLSLLDMLKSWNRCFSDIFGTWLICLWAYIFDLSLWILVSGQVAIMRPGNMVPGPPTSSQSQAHYNPIPSDPALPSSHIGRDWILQASFSLWHVCAVYLVYKPRTQMGPAPQSFPRSHMGICGPGQLWGDIVEGSMSSILKVLVKMRLTDVELACFCLFKRKKWVLLFAKQFKSNYLKWIN